MPTQGDPRIANGNSLARKSAGHDPRDSPGFSRPQRGSILAIHFVENPGFCMARLSRTLPTPMGIDFGNSFGRKSGVLRGPLSANPESTRLSQTLPIPVGIEFGNSFNRNSLVLRGPLSANPESRLSQTPPTLCGDRLWQIIR